MSLSVYSRLWHRGQDLKCLTKLYRRAAPPSLFTCSKNEGLMIDLQRPSLFRNGAGGVEGRPWTCGGVEASRGFLPGSARRTAWERDQGQGQSWEQEMGRMLTHRRQGLGFFWVRNTPNHLSHQPLQDRVWQSGSRTQRSQKDEGWSHVRPWTVLSWRWAGMQHVGAESVTRCWVCGLEDGDGWGKTICYRETEGTTLPDHRCLDIEGSPHSRVLCVSFLFKCQPWLGWVSMGRPA